MHCLRYVIDTDFPTRDNKKVIHCYIVNMFDIALFSLKCVVQWSGYFIATKSIFTESFDAL